MEIEKFGVNDVLIYDIETETIDERPNPHKDKLRLFGFYSYKLKKSGVIPFMKKDLIQKIINNHRFLVGFNNIKYDNVVLVNEGFDLRYKRIIDLYDVFKKRAMIMITKKGMLGDKLMQYSLDYITRFLDLVDDDTAKEEIDYNIFKKKSWTKKEIEEMKKYTLRDIEITKKLYEWVENYFYTFRDFVSKRDVDNKSYLTDTVAMFAYKAICNALDWEPVLDKEAMINEKDGVSFEGGYVAYPAGERFEGNIYCLDYNSLYPSIMIQANLYGRNKNQNIGWHGKKEGNPLSWEVVGYYDDKKLHPVGELLKTWYHLRLMFKRQAVLENGQIIKLIEADKYIGQKYYHVTQTKEGKPTLELREMTKAQADYFINISKQGKDPREYTVKIIINCFHPDTEVLTVEGVKNIKDIKEGDKVWSINPKTKELEIKEVIYTESRDYNGYLDVYENENINFIITPEHKFIDDKGKFIKSKEIKRRKEFKFPVVKHNFLEKTDGYFYLTDYMEEDNLVVGIRPYIEKNEWIKKNVKKEHVIDGQYYYLKILYKNIKNKIKKIEDAEIKIIENNIKNNNFIPFRYERKLLLKLIAYFINYGSIKFSINKNNIKYHETFHRIFFRIKEKFKKERFLDFIEVLNKLGLFYYISEKGVSMSKSQILSRFFLFFKDLEKNNTERINFLFDKITKEEAKFLIEELTRTLYLDEKNKFMTESKLMMKDFIQLVLMVGGRVNVEQYKLTEGNENNYLYTIWYFFDQPLIQNKNYKKIKYKGKIYNLSIKDNSTLLAGIKGKFNWISQTTYGILNTPYYKLVYDPVAGADCTRLGRQWIKHARKKFRDAGYKVIYTDSVEEEAKIRIAIENKRYFISFKELWEKVKPFSRYVEIGEKEYLFPNMNIFTLSVDQSFILQWRRLNYIMRHKINENMYKIINNDLTLKVTRHHSIINAVGRRLKPVKPQKIRHVLVYFNGVEKRFRFRIEKEMYEGYVYDVEVEETHNFFANDILVHNTDSVYIVDPYNDKEKMLKVKDQVIEDIKSTVPFPQSFFDMGIDAEIKYMFFFKGTKKGDIEHDMDEDDKINRELGLMKKNYIYVEKDGKVVIKNLGIKKKSISQLSKTIFWDYIVPSIKKEGKVMFSKVEIENIMFDLLKKDVKYALIRKEVDNPERYKVNTSLQAQIAKRYGAGIHFLIPNTKGIGAGKGVKYCTLKEFQENKLSILDIDLSVYWSELNYFVKKPTQLKLFQ